MPSNTDVTLDSFSTKRKNGLRLPTIYNERFLLLLLRVLASSRDISKRTLNNVYRFVSMCDMNWYKRDRVVGGILEAISILLTNRDNGTFDNLDQEQIQNTILAQIAIGVGEIYAETRENLIVPVIKSWRSKDTEADFVIKQIELHVKYGHIVEQKEDISDIITDLSSGNIVHLEKTISKFENVVEDIHEKFKKTKDSTGNGGFLHLTDDDFVETYMKEVFRISKNPKSNLKTGVKKFNEILSIQGGFVNGKYYIFYADVNSFKSAILIHCARWIQKYNSHLFIEQFKETKRRPTVVFCSFENSQREDIERAFKIYTNHNIGEFGSFDNIRTAWGSSYYEGSSIIDITFIHLDAETATMSDIEGKLDALSDDGYDPIALIIDYIEVIAAEPEDIRKDRHVQLKNISQKLSGLAHRRDIPVITAHQINRVGQAVLGQAKQQGKKNAIRLLDRSMIGESSGIEKKTDMSFFIGLEKSIDPITGQTRTYLCANRIKQRYRVIPQSYFVHEVVDGGIYIEDDYWLDSYGSLDEIPTGFDKKEDEFEFSSSGGQKGTRGQANVRKKVNMSETVVANSPPSLASIIDDKPIGDLFYECPQNYKLDDKEIETSASPFSKLTVDEDGFEYYESDVSFGVDGEIEV